MSKPDPTGLKTIAVCLGDITGIGPEVSLKAVAAEMGRGRFVLIGDKAHARSLVATLGLNLPLADYRAGADTGPLSILDPGDDPLPKHLPPGDPAAARAAVAWLRIAAEGCLRKEFDAMVTAPVNKRAIIRAGIAFVGQTELLSEIAATDQTVMMLLGQDDRGRWLRVALVTTHVAIRNLADTITEPKVRLAITLARKACIDLKLTRQRIAVCGLNPHAGEGGEIGREEIMTVAPAVEAARAAGIDVTGPLSADALFHYAYRGDYDAVVAMYHDQGLAPLKMVAFEQGINWTLGLPFVRTSPDHGTAYDIVGKGIADARSMRAAVRLATELG